MKKKLLIISTVLFIFSEVRAQENPNPITTAAPFLLIAPDARAGGMGDIGVATAPDAFSQHYNASKLAFMPSQFSVGVTYTPWLRELTNDIFLGGFSFANRINERSAWATSFKYFNLGEIQLTDDFGGDQGIEKLNEFSLDGSYSIKLNKTYSMGVTMRYIRSDLGIKSGNTDIRPVNTFSVDVSGYFQSDENNYGNFNGVWRGGFNISNIGPKVSYTDDGQDNYIPTNLKIGGGFDFILDQDNVIGLTTEFNKLLVPTPKDQNGDGVIDSADNDIYQNETQWQLLESFWQAPSLHALPNAERIADFFQRVSKCWHKCLDDIITQESTLIVCHGGVIRMILASILKQNITNYNTINKLKKY